MTTTYVRRGPTRRKSAASAHRAHATTRSGATSERDVGQRARRDRAADRDWAPCWSTEDRDPPLPPLPPSSVCDTVRAKLGLAGAPGGRPAPGTHHRARAQRRTQCEERRRFTRREVPHCRGFEQRNPHVVPSSSAALLRKQGASLLSSETRGRASAFIVAFASHARTTTS